MIDTSPETERQSGVAAVDRAFSIIEALASATGTMTLSELSRATGLYKSTVLRLLESLERAQYVSRLPNAHYILGPMAYRLGLAYERTNDVAAYVSPVLDALVEAGTESASFHVPYPPEQRLCILRKDSQHSTLDSVRAGQVLPLVGAAGTIVRAYSLPGNGSDRPSLVKSYGERDASCAGIAAPVLGSEGRFIGAISLSGPIHRFTAESVEHMSGLLLQAAEKLSVRFGGSLRALARRP
ncbi:IclR family transcriptional regulator [Microvirga sp. P5_D2]